jgi:hypothetical protein
MSNKNNEQYRGQIYYLTHKEQIKNRANNYYQKNKKKMTRRNRLKYKKNIEHYRKYQRDYRNANIEEMRQYQKQYMKIWRKNNPLKCKNQRYKRDYNLTIHDIVKLKRQQNYKCPICLSFLTSKFVVDHNHTTEKVRGLLCRRCNTSLGLFKDSKYILKRAIKYLEEQNV